MGAEHDEVAAPYLLVQKIPVYTNEPQGATQNVNQPDNAHRPTEKIQ